MKIIVYPHGTISPVRHDYALLPEEAVAAFVREHGYPAHNECIAEAGDAEARALPRWHQVQTYGRRLFRLFKASPGASAMPVVEDVTARTDWPR